VARRAPSPCHEDGKIVLSRQMKDTFLKIVIVGFPFGFSLMWFTYWIVKIYKGKQKALQHKKECSADAATRPTES
jgi:hypothetical protein